MSKALGLIASFALIMGGAVLAYSGAYVLAGGNVDSLISDSQFGAVFGALALTGAATMAAGVLTFAAIARAAR